MMRPWLSGHRAERHAVELRLPWWAALSCVILSAYGCVGLVAADRNELSGLKNEPSIPVVCHRPQDLFVSMAGVGGKKMIREYGLQDPALRLRDRLISALATDLGIRGFDVAPEPLENDDFDTVRARFPRRVVLDFKTTLWTLFPSKGIAFSSDYMVLYGVRARLLRTEDGKIMWEGQCQTERNQSADRSWDDLTANGAALLKARLYEIADACAERLRAQLLAGDKEITVK